MLRPLSTLVLLQATSPALGLSAGPTTTRATFNISDGGTSAAGAAVAGDVLLFAGGKGGASELADVSVYTPGKGFRTLKGVLSGARAQMTSTQLPDGSVAMFAGGEDARKMKFSGVDIYTASTGKWTSAKLSQPRSFPAAASVVVDNRALSLFAGGEMSEGATGTDSSRVDIYEHGRRCLPATPRCPERGTPAETELCVWCWSRQGLGGQRGPTQQAA